MAQTFIKTNGYTIESDTFMHGPALDLGMVWIRDGDYGPWRESLDPHCAESDPNHRNNDLHIFGYHHADLMARQYR